MKENLSFKPNFYEDRITFKLSFIAKIERPNLFICQLSTLTEPWMMNKNKSRSFAGISETETSESTENGP